jgi:hypothetical protein
MMIILVKQKCCCCCQKSEKESEENDWQIVLLTITEMLLLTNGSKTHSNKSATTSSRLSHSSFHCHHIWLNIETVILYVCYCNHSTTTRAVIIICCNILRNDHAKPYKPAMQCQCNEDEQCSPSSCCVPMKTPPHRLYLLLISHTAHHQIPTHLHMSALPGRLLLS